MIKTKCHGIMKHKDGSEYSGNWSNDLKEGKGEMKNNNGNNYSGYWKEDNLLK